MLQDYTPGPKSQGQWVRIITPHLLPWGHRMEIHPLGLPSPSHAVESG